MNSKEDGTMKTVQADLAMYKETCQTLRTVLEKTQEHYNKRRKTANRNSLR